MSGKGRIDSRQIEDGNLGEPDLAHFNWKVVQRDPSTNYPTIMSGTKISGDADYFWMQNLYRDPITSAVFRIKDEIFFNKNGNLRWSKDTYLTRDSNGLMDYISGTIFGEDSD